MDAPLEDFYTSPNLFPLHQPVPLLSEPNRPPVTEGIMFVLGAKICPIVLTAGVYFQIKHDENGYSATDALQEICEGPLDWFTASYDCEGDKAKLLYTEFMRYKDKINTLFNLKAPFKVIRVVHILGLTLDHIKKGSQWRQHGEFLYEQHILKIMELRRLAEEASQMSNDLLDSMWDDLLFKFDEDVLTDE